MARGVEPLAIENMFFKPRNEKNQEALDKATQKLLNTKVQDLLQLPDYGSSTIELNGETIKYSWWCYKFNDKLSHIVQQIDQNTFFGTYYKFLSGVKIINKKEVLLLTDDEIGEYD